MHDLSATIVAVATPPGRGGIGCLRLSGDAAHRIAAALFHPAGRAASPAGPPRFGRFVDADGEVVDHGYLVLFAAGRSFTGEDVAELWTHGSPAVLAALLDAALAGGARGAGPGEFTYRALRHGRLDLARAEAVRDLVDARTRHQARIAARQAEGELARHLAPLRERLEEWIARTEAAVEFVDESETHLSRDGLTGAVAELRRDCAALLDGYRAGRIVREGATLAIVGAPNAGKSSLFNRLLARDRAIVTPVAGTTRDTLEEAVDLDGVAVRLVDTAGLREAADALEEEGIRRARAALAEADLVVLVVDGARDPLPDELAAVRRGVADEGRTVVTVSKADLPDAAARPLPCPGAIRVSSVSGAGLGELRAALRRRLESRGSLEDPVVTDARHAGALEATAAALDRAAAAVRDGVPEDLVLVDLHEARRALGEIGGEFGGEALYDRIFSTFCIGK